MSFTNKELDIIKEKLKGVETPSVDEAWSRMEEMMENPPAQSGTTPVSGLRYYVILNSVIGALIAVSSVLYFGVSNASQKDQMPEELPTSSVAVFEPLMEATTPQFDHSNDLNLPVLQVEDDEIIKENIASVTTKKSTPRTSNQDVSRSEVIAEKPVVRKQAPTTETDQLLNDLSLFQREELDFDYGHSEHRDRWDPEQDFKLNLWGVHAGIQVFPEMSFNTLGQTITAGVFYRHYMNYKSALEFQGNYNAVRIRPLSFVESTMDGSITRTDSSVVNQLNYGSIQLLYHRKLHKHTSWSAGLQYGYLASLKGDLYKKDNSAGPGEYTIPVRTKLSNPEIVRKHDFAFIADINWHLDRVLVGLRYQQSLSDYTISPGSNRYGAIQLRTSVILNKAKK